MFGGLGGIVRWWWEVCGSTVGSSGEGGQWGDAFLQSRGVALSAVDCSSTPYSQGVVKD